VCLLGATAAGAQEGADGRADLPGSSKQDRYVCEPDRCVFDGNVEFLFDGGSLLFADHVEIFPGESRFVAKGSVVFGGPEGRMAADRVEYDYARNLGTFYDARGSFDMGDEADPSQFAGQDADFEIWGDTIEQIGPRTYRLRNGGFTTCTQPEPRWKISTNSLTVNLDDYAVAWNTVLRVKNVPILYLPFVRIPLQEEQRATGFLMPSYGTSTLRGQALSNQFFWAIGRSHDATIFHDWFTRTGQGTGAEYRYVAAAQSSGNVRAYFLDQHEAEFTQGGVTRTLPESTSFELTGSLNHQIRQGMRARLRIDYFSDVVTQQLYHQDVTRATRNSRVVEGSLSAAFGPTSTSLLYQRRELLSGDRSQTYGSTPRISTTVAPQRLFGAPIYGSLNAEYAFLPNRVVDADTLTADNGYSRVEVAPTLRVPMSRLTFLSVNTSLTYRTTRYSRSIGTGQSTIDQPYFRQFASLRSEIVGPVLNRIWDRPESRFAERLKHVIEPAFTVDVTSRISDYARTPTTSDLSDFVVSGATRLIYGVTNRLFARGQTAGGGAGQAREFATVGLQQTYYTNPESGRFDSDYQSTYGESGREFSPLALTARVSPSARLDATLRGEYDTISGDGLRLLSAGGRINVADASTSVSYSRSRGATFEGRHALNGSTTLRWLDGRATGTYAFTWDIGRSVLQNQSVMASYIAQCCGIQLEFQRYNFPDVIGFPVAADTRFNLGIVLAGLGTFSNFFGALGGQ
jgi:hypothetical protein